MLCYFIFNFNDFSIHFDEKERPKEAYCVIPNLISFTNKILTFWAFHQCLVFVQQLLDKMSWPIQSLINPKVLISRELLIRFLLLLDKFVKAVLIVLISISYPLLLFTFWVVISIKWFLIRLFEVDFFKLEMRETMCNRKIYSGV